eukprot:351759-Chlamydomonas_euryale.AAC.3
MEIPSGGGMSKAHPSHRTSPARAPDPHNSRAKPHSHQFSLFPVRNMYCRCMAGAGCFGQGAICACASVDGRWKLSTS